MGDVSDVLIFEFDCVEAVIIRQGYHQTEGGYWIEVVTSGVL